MGAGNQRLCLPDDLTVFCKGYILIRIEIRSHFVCNGNCKIGGKDSGILTALHIFINADLIRTVPRGKWKSGVSAGWKIIGIGHIIWSGNLQLHGFIFSVPGCHHIAILCMGGIQ